MPFKHESSLTEYPDMSSKMKKFKIKIKKGKKDKRNSVTQINARE